MKSKQEAQWACIAHLIFTTDAAPWHKLSWPFWPGELIIFEKQYRK